MRYAIKNGPTSHKYVKHIFVKGPLKLSLSSQGGCIILISLCRVLFYLCPSELSHRHRMLSRSLTSFGKSCRCANSASLSRLHLETPSIRTGHRSLARRAGAQVARRAGGELPTRKGKGKKTRSILQIPFSLRHLRSQNFLVSRMLSNCRHQIHQ